VQVDLDIVVLKRVVLSTKSDSVQVDMYTNRDGVIKLLGVCVCVCVCLCVCVCERERERERESGWVGGWVGGCGCLRVYACVREHTCIRTLL
jgi:hypothetical protein